MSDQTISSPWVTRSRVTHVQMRPYVVGESMLNILRGQRQNGRLAEWLKAAVLKTVVGESSPWVRLPHLPPFIL